MQAYVFAVRKNHEESQHLGTNLVLLLHFTRRVRLSPLFKVHSEVERNRLNFEGVELCGRAEQSSPAATIRFQT